MDYKPLVIETIRCVLCFFASLGFTYYGMKKIKTTGRERVAAIIALGIIMGSLHIDAPLDMIKQDFVTADMVYTEELHKNHGSIFFMYRHFDVGGDTIRLSCLSGRYFRSMEPGQTYRVTYAERSGVLLQIEGVVSWLPE